MLYTDKWTKHSQAKSKTNPTGVKISKGGGTCGRGWSGVKGSCVRAQKGMSRNEQEKLNKLALANKIRAARGMGSTSGGPGKPKAVEAVKPIAPQAPKPATPIAQKPAPAAKPAAAPAKPASSPTKPATPMTPKPAPAAPVAAALKKGFGAMLEARKVGGGGFGFGKANNKKKK